jgi:hypothetical protein
MSYRDGETITIENYQVYFYRNAGGLRAEIRHGDHEIAWDHITTYEEAALAGILAKEDSA